MRALVAAAAMWPIVLEVRALRTALALTGWA